MSVDELPELDHLETLLSDLSRWGRCEVLATVSAYGRNYPIHSIVLGTADPASPILLFVGGVHGLERIGTNVVLSYMHTLAERLEWDEISQRTLDQSRIAFVPLLNPIGMARRSRANGNGVDLMRNAPPAPGSEGTLFLGGHRLTAELPWYMGADGAPMEVEAQALCEFARRELFQSPSVLSLDVHSGFGMIDRLWFPYARSRLPFPGLCEAYRLHLLLDRTLPHHVYRMEPQAQAYTIKGDLWDFLYDEYRQRMPDGSFLPLTLEMGSWLWVKKNPLQALSTLGSFNPMVPHRMRRTLRRHLLLFEFLHRAACSPAAWSIRLENGESRTVFEREALELWYAG
jgi:hypothetical protein